MKKKLAPITAAWIAAVAILAQNPAPAQDPGATAPPVAEEPTLPDTAAPPSIAAGLNEGEGKVVKSVEVKLMGQTAADEQRIRAFMSLKPGETYTRDKEEADIKRLYDSGVVDNVIISTVDVPGGVRVVVNVTARAGLGDVLFLGNSQFSSQTLRKEIDIKTGETVDDAQLQTAQRAIEDLYKNKGYTDVTVSYTLTPAPNGFSQVTFKIDEGQRGYLHDIIFEGNDHVSKKTLKKVMKSDNRGLRFWRGAKLEQSKIDTDVRAIEDHFRELGYMNAQVTGYERVSVTDKKVDLVIRIAEGDLYTVKSVSVIGAKTYKPEIFIPAFELEAGKLFNGTHMKSDIAKIRSFYGSRGHADVKVTPQIRNAGGNEVDIVYAIEEGPIFDINKINFEGNEQTKDEVMRREMAIAPGERYNQTTIDVSERRLKGLGYFKEVSVLPVDADTPGYKDINVSVKEQQTGQLNFGAGFSSIDSLVGFVSVHESNFDFGWPPKGAGQRFSMDLRIGTKRKDITIGWYEPWLFGYPLGFGVDLYYTEKTYLSDVYDQKNIGGDFYFRKRINEVSDWRLQFLGEQVSIEDIDEDASEAIKAEEGDFMHAEASLAYNYDSRDDNILPRKGMKFAVEGSLAGGDFEDYGFLANFSKPIQLPFDLIFTVNGSYETVDEISGGRVPIYERVFLGGANNLRGFKFREVGPADENGEPLGGKSAWFISGELTFPIFERVRGATFVDVGGVDETAWGFGNMNSDVGIGVRLRLPVLGPIKIDYAFPIQADEFNDNSGRFNISVDYKF